jgi:hypothetical protein
MRVSRSATHDLISPVAGSTSQGLEYGVCFRGGAGCAASSTTMTSDGQMDGHAQCRTGSKLLGTRPKWHIRINQRTGAGR